jgi:hypothetical protein
MKIKRSRRTKITMGTEKSCGTRGTKSTWGTSRRRRKTKKEELN